MNSALPDDVEVWITTVTSTFQFDVDSYIIHENYVHSDLVRNSFYYHRLLRILNIL